MSLSLSYWLIAANLPAIGSQRFLTMLESFSTINRLFEATHDELRHAGIPEEAIQLIKQPQWQLIEKELRWVEAADHHIITFDDPAYPPLLKKISTPPLVLFLLGNKAALQQQQIAIVGARNATLAGLKNAEIFARHLAEGGFAVTSGLALGIDGAAHRGALAGKGVTIGVCGTGLDQIYPRTHRKLYADIINNDGAILSEFMLGVSPQPYNFPRRNGTIAGMSLGVLVIEASIKSGSLITARYAVEQGREVFAVPGSIHNPLSRGCHHLIKQGAALVETAEDILNELGSLRMTLQPSPSNLPKPTYSPKPPTTLPPNHHHLLQKIDYETTPFDVIHLRSRLTAGEVSSILLLLELQGYIASGPGGYQRITAA